MCLKMYSRVYQEIKKFHDLTSDDNKQFDLVIHNRLCPGQQHQQQQFQSRPQLPRLWRCPTSPTVEPQLLLQPQLPSTSILPTLQAHHQA